MAETYRRPLMTVSWLGLESEKEMSALAVEWIKRISNQVVESDDLESTKWLKNNARDLLKGSAPGPMWTSVGASLRRSYWTRVWTSQECGKSSQ